MTTDDGRAQFRLRHGTKVCDFVMANNPVDIIQGPLGSGKTHGVCARIMRHVQEQRPSPLDRIRRTRFALVRNTYPDLIRTTIRTWEEVVPEIHYGKINRGQPLRHQIRFDDVMSEVDFLALDKPEDVRKLKSTEYTGIAFNEIPYIDKQIFDEADSRLRYPPKKHGGPSWRGLIGDANAPDEDHWLALMTGQTDFPPGMTEEERAEYAWPDDWGFFLQPPAVLERRNERGDHLGWDVNPHAENLQNLPDDYYDRQMRAKKRAWIENRLGNKVVFVAEGDPVYPMFRREFHVAREMLRPVRGREVLVAVDPGRWPAALFMQEMAGRVYVQYELLGANVPAETFAPKVKRFLEQHYEGCSWRAVGDPKGNDRGQATDQSSYDVWAGCGVPVVSAPVKQNRIGPRVEALSHILNDNPAGYPRLVISPWCRTLIVGLAGKYCVEKDETGELKPTKNRYSHPCNALEYGVLGLGEGKRMIGLEPAQAPRATRVYAGRRSMRRVS